MMDTKRREYVCGTKQVMATKVKDTKRCEWYAHRTPDGGHDFLFLILFEQVMFINVNGVDDVRKTV